METGQGDDRELQALRAEVERLTGEVDDLRRQAAAGTAAEAALRESEEKFRAAFQTSPDAINLNRMDGVYVDINEGFTHLTGYTRDDVLGVSSTDLAIWAHPPDRDRLVAELRAHGVMEDLEAEFRCKDGTVRTALMSARIIRPGGTPLILSVTRDITGHKRAAEALRASEARYRTLVEEAADGILLGNPDGTISGANSRMLALCGLPREELLGRHIRELFTPESLASAPLRFDLLHQGRAVTTERELQLPGGSALPIEMHTKQMEDGSYQSIIRDIALRRRAEQALRESEARFRQVVESAEAVIFVVDTEGVFRLTEGLALRRMGLTPGQGVGTSVFEVYRNHPEVTDSVRRALAGESRFATVRTGGRVFDTRFSPLRGTAGTPTGVLGVATDSTDRMQAEERRLELERQLLHAQKLESLGVMAGGIAHDFNNLLMAILGNAELAAEQLPADTDTAGCVDRVVQAALRAADLTRQMLAYAGQGSFTVEPLGLNELVEHNVDLLRAALARTVTLELALAPDLPAIYADRTQLQQLAMNLLTNASEAAGDRPGLVTLRTGVLDMDAAALAASRVEAKPPPGRFVCLEVADTGCGMDRRTLHQLFDPFFTTKFTGRGLGMAAALGIVAGHRGAIFIDSAPGQGTTVRVLFPATADTADAPRPGCQIGAARPPRLAGTVLVVDDEPPVREVCAGLLEGLGLRALTAGGGAAAVAQLREPGAQIDAVLLDLTMPDMDGVACAAALWEIRPEVPVILASGFSPETIAGRCDLQRFAGTMQKPYTLARLAEELARVLGPRPG